MTHFDPNQFLESVTTDTYKKAPPLPDGDYTGVIQDVVVKEWTSKKDPSKSGYALDVTLNVELSELAKQAMNSDFASAKLVDSIILSMTPSGELDFAPGKNRQLGSYRDAIGLNEPGEKFALSMLKGKALLVKTKLEEYNGNFYPKVKGVTSL